MRPDYADVHDAANAATPCGCLGRVVPLDEPRPGGFCLPPERLPGAVDAARAVVEQLDQEAIQSAGTASGRRSRISGGGIPLSFRLLPSGAVQLLSASGGTYVVSADGQRCSCPGGWHVKPCWHRRWVERTRQAGGFGAGRAQGANVGPQVQGRQIIRDA